MVKYSLDSSLIIDVLRGQPAAIRHLSEIKDEDQNNIYICSVVYYEVVRGFRDETSKNKIEMFNKLYDNTKHLSLDEKSANKAVDIYRKLASKGLNIGDNDIYIAAISIVNDCTLVTANTRHFERVEGLKFVNWRV